MALAQISSPAQAVAVMLPILCVMDLIGVWAYRENWHRPSMRILGVGCLVGTVIGMLTFKWMDEQAIRLIVGVIAIAFFVDFFRGGGEKGRPRRMSSKANTSQELAASITATKRTSSQASPQVATAGDIRATRSGARG